MLIGWRRTTLFEDDRQGSDSSISLVGFVPRSQLSEIVFQYRLMGLVIHHHALARLFERALQPPENIAAELLDPGFLRAFPKVVPDDAKPGFAVPFRNGRFVGSLEWVREGDGTMSPMFGVRSWVPVPLDRLQWTEKSSRTLIKAIEVDRKRRILDFM
ncbi:hypothetical protein DM450_24925 (plasmid) [Sphingomonas sp. IC081]|nr:hypothetical protein DM450_24925 [Sphingomonas sp. IC081]